MVVLSLCDGISTGQVILQELGIKVDKYYSSEIDDKAISVTQSHFPNTVQIGDICKIRYEKGILYTENGAFEVPKIDLILSGTPCVSFSFAGKQDKMDGISGELFYEFSRILKEVTPTYFFFENVKMSEDAARSINKELGVEYIYLNSCDFSPQVRKRYYWTNIVDKDTCLKNKPINSLRIKDILDDLPFDIDCSEIFELNPYMPINGRDNILCINPRGLKKRRVQPNVCVQTSQRRRIYDIEGKCPALCANLYDLKITKDHKKYRRLTVKECERLQGLPEGYTSILTKRQAGFAIGNGWQVDTVKYILEFMKV